MAQPTVTVCIPTFNYARYLDGAIASVLDQTFEDFELLIADDASSDNTATVVSPYLNDPRVRFMPNPVNRGMFANFNRCVEAARGRYIKFLMADDLMARTFLERMVEIMDAHEDVALGTTGGWVMDGDGAVYGQEIQPFGHGPVVTASRVFRESARGFNSVGMPTCTLIRTAAIREAGGFDADYAPAADVALWFELLARSDLCFIPECLTFLRIHSEHTHQWGDEPNESIFRVWQNASASSSSVATPELAQRACRRASISFTVYAVKCLAHGEARRARRLMGTVARNVGLGRALFELAQQTPRLLLNRGVMFSARRLDRSVLYSPFPRVGLPAETFRREVRAATGEQLNNTSGAPHPVASSVGRLRSR